MELENNSKNSTVIYLSHLLNQLSPDNATEILSMIDSRLDEHEMIVVMHHGSHADQALATQYFMLKIACCVFLKDPGSCVRLVTELLSSYVCHDSGEVGNIAFATIQGIRAKCDFVQWSEGWQQMKEQLNILANMFIKSTDLRAMFEKVLD